MYLLLSQAVLANSPSALLTASSFVKRISGIFNIMNLKLINEFLKEKMKMNYSLFFIHPLYSTSLQVI